MGAEAEERTPRDLGTGERIASRVQGSVLRALRDATREVCGDAWAARLAALLPAGTIERLGERGWVPLDYLTAWVDAAWDGPLAHDHAALLRFVDRVMELDFGQTRRVLLTIATPHGVVRRAADLWRGELSTGRLVAYATSPTSARLTLHDHAFLESPLAREVVAETLRYALVLAGAHEAVAQSSGALGEPLVVDVSWR